MEFDGRSFALEAFCVVELGITLCETFDRFALFPTVAFRLRSCQVASVMHRIVYFEYLLAKPLT